MVSYIGSKRVAKSIWTAGWRAATKIVGRSSAREARNRGPAVRILAYHRISCAPSLVGSELEVAPRSFRDQLSYIKAAGYRVVPLADVPGILAVSGCPCGDTLPYLVLTFDDGYRDSVTRTAPMLCDFGFSATFFISTGFVDSREPFPWVEHPEQDPETAPLTWDEVRDLRARGFDIGSHAVTHRDLGSLDPDDVLWELAESRARLEAETGRAPRALCYPSGGFNDRTVAVAAEAGYEIACTSVPGINRRSISLLGLRRTPVQTSDSLNVFKAKLEGAFDWSLPPGASSWLRQALLRLDSASRRHERRVGNR